MELVKRGNAIDWDHWLWLDGADKIHCTCQFSCRRQKHTGNDDRMKRNDVANNTAITTTGYFLRDQWFGRSDIFKQTCLAVVFAGDRSSSTQWHTTNTGFFSSNAHVVLHGQEVQQLVAGSRSNSLKMLAKPQGGLNFCYKWILGICLQLRVKMWNWNILCWICFHQRRCAARKRVIFNETHFVTEFGQHLVTNVNLCSLHVNIIPSPITSGTTMPTEAQKLCTASFRSRTAGRDSSKPWVQDGYRREQYCKLLLWLYLYLLREVNSFLTAPSSITSCNSVMSHRDTTCRGSDTKH